MPWWLIEALIFFGGVSAGWNLSRWNDAPDPRLGRLRIMPGPDLPRRNERGDIVAAPSFVVERFEARFLLKPRWKKVSKEFPRLEQAKYFEAQMKLSNYVGLEDSNSSLSKS